MFRAEMNNLEALKVVGSFLEPLAEQSEVQSAVVVMNTPAENTFAASSSSGGCSSSSSSRKQMIEPSLNGPPSG